MGRRGLYGIPQLSCMGEEQILGEKRTKWKSHPNSMWSNFLKEKGIKLPGEKRVWNISNFCGQKCMAWIFSNQIFFNWLKSFQILNIESDYRFFIWNYDIGVIAKGKLRIELIIWLPTTKTWKNKSNDP